MGHLGVVDLVVWLALTAAVVVGVPLVIFVFARRILRAVERRSARESQPIEYTEHLQRVEEQLHDLATENERLREGQRFTHELLRERSPEVKSPPPDAI